MIDVKCMSQGTVLLQDISPFQGSLKKRTQENINELKASIKREGLLMPFAIWKHDGKNFLLDGHGRLEALYQLVLEDESLLRRAYPCVYIEAETEDDARKALLQITSSYGKVTTKGARIFMATIPSYKAPAVAKLNLSTVKPVITVQKGIPEIKTRVIKIRVPKDKVDEVKDILATVEYIEVL